MHSVNIHKDEILQHLQRVTGKNRIAHTSKVSANDSSDPYVHIQFFLQWQIYFQFHIRMPMTHDQLKVVSQVYIPWSGWLISARQHHNGLGILSLNNYRSTILASVRLLIIIGRKRFMEQSIKWVYYNDTRNTYGLPMVRRNNKRTSWSRTIDKYIITTTKWPFS